MQMGQHLREQRGEAVEVVVAVVEVVDDADVRDPCCLSRSMTAIWFSGSPNQPPWLYSASVQPIFAASSASGRTFATAVSIRRACSSSVIPAMMAPRPTEAQRSVLMSFRRSASRTFFVFGFISPGET